MTRKQAHPSHFNIHSRIYQNGDIIILVYVIATVNSGTNLGGCFIESI